MDVNIPNKRAVLLTGTIIPNSVYTHYTDAEARLKDYLFALDFYCRLFKNDDVFFLENSDFDLENNKSYLELKSRSRHILFRFPQSEKFYEGKGYQEFEMLDRAVDQLKGQYTSIIKLTGRYVIKNAVRLTDFKCNGIVIDLMRRQGQAQTYFFYCTMQFYLDNIKGLYRKVNDNEGVFIEQVVYDKISPALLKYSRLFPATPHMSGITGSYGIVLKRNSLKIVLRNVERFFYNIVSIKSFFY